MVVSQNGPLNQHPINDLSLFSPHIHYAQYNTTCIIEIPEFSKQIQNIIWYSQENSFQESCSIWCGEWQCYYHLTRVRCEWKNEVMGTEASIQNKNDYFKTMWW